MSPVSPNRRHGRFCFYKYMRADTARAVLSSCALRWSSPLLFNDLFDVPRRAVLPFTVDELQAAVHEEFLRVMKGKVQTRHPVLRYLSGILNNVSVGEHRAEVLEELRASIEEMAPTSTKALDMFREVWNEMVPTLRILCLSEVNDSLAMWAHYAEHHKGAVLRFDVADDLDSALLLAQPVIYSDNEPTLPGKEVWARMVVRHESFPSDYFKEYHYVKRTEWAPEREWRVISYAAKDETGLFRDHGFHPRELSAVYLGANMSPQDEAAIAAAVSGRFAHVSLYRAQVDQERRRLSFVNLSSRQSTYAMSP
jgi:Protein of unknown function (DUF2971)